MLSISHAATGAFIAVVVPNPWLSVPLILLSHYLEDAVPHWDVGTGMSHGLKSPQKALAHEVVDLLGAGIIVLFLYYSQFPLLPFTGFNLQNLTPYWGAFLALVPDFLEAPRNFLKSEPSWLRPLNKFHKSFHHSIPHVVTGLTPQILLLILIWYFH